MILRLLPHITQNASVLGEDGQQRQMRQMRLNGRSRQVVWRADRFTEETVQKKTRRAGTER